MAEKQKAKVFSDKEFTKIFDDYLVKIGDITRQSTNNAHNTDSVPSILTGGAPGKPDLKTRPFQKGQDRQETNTGSVKPELPVTKEPREVNTEAEDDTKNTILEHTIDYTDITRRMNKKKLGELLVENKIINSGQLQSALEIQNREGGRLGEVLIKQGLIKPETLLTFLSRQLDVPIVNLKGLIIKQEALALVPEKLARERNVIPVEKIGDKLVIVMGYPEDIITIDDIGLITGMKICIALGNPSDIEEAVFSNYESSRKLDGQMSETEGPADEEDDIQADIDFSPAAQNLNKIINQAIHDGASDIHVEPYRKRLRIRFRIDGVLKDKYSLPVSANDAILNRIKILGKMNIAEHRRPQDGQFTIKSGNKNIDIRVATIGMANGERATLRILDKSLNLVSLDKLGFAPDTLEHMKTMLKNSFGMILVGGPTGSGKTTTLYSMINHLDRHELNIMTIEDPIEYSFNDISQMQVNEKAEITFASCLKATLRHDPDVVLIGEIRDPETAKIAVQAALTGHLVLASIHANDASSMLYRLIHLGIEPYLISSTLIGLVAQRLVRRICSNCSEESAPSAEESKAYKEITGEELAQSRSGKGCNICSNTGYHGRTGIFELLIMNDTIRSKLIAGASTSEIRQEAINHGMVTMGQAGMAKVKKGLSTIKDVLHSTATLG